jgi:UDP-2-acetamido-2-deoxy-ribo-hexuluronate aminotransferase
MQSYGIATTALFFRTFANLNQLMRPIQMVDLKAQYLNMKDEVDAAIHQVLDSTAFIGGKAVQDFSANLASYTGARHVIPCANGTDALQIAMMALGLQPGDEVITPSFTYIATTEVVALLKLKPVFVEVDPQTFCIDPAAIEQAITPRTKAIVPVHLYGQSADMQAILDIARRHGLYVIEDNAQAIGATYTFADGTKRQTGTMGTIGTTSFFPSKNLGCYGDGGAILTNDDQMADKLKMIANHGQKVRYYHEVVGCNSRLDTIQAAILDVKLKRLNDYITARQRVAAAYDSAFSGHPSIATPKVAAGNTHVYHQYTLQLEGVDRDGLQQYLADRSIPSMIYYPVPAHRQRMFTDLGAGGEDLPVTDWLTKRVISLPIHTEMLPEHIEMITSSVLDYIEKTN